MNFLKSVLTSSGGFPGYTIQDKIDLPTSALFVLHNAVKRDDNSPCSVLTFETSKAPTLLPLARNYHSKLRSMKHPGVLKFLDSLETDGWIYIATERISPLSHTLAKDPASDVITWGLYNIAQTIAFVNTEAASIHGNIRSSSVFTTESGEWKMAGFETFSCMKDEDPLILRFGGLVPDIYSITPQEVQNKGFGELQSFPLTSLDSWQYACFIWSCFNGPFSSASSLQSQGKIPKNMFAIYKRLLSSSPQARLSVSNFLDHGRRPSGFFRTDIITVTEAIPSLPLKSKVEVERFLEDNMKTIALLPSGFTKNKLLPEMIKSFEFGGGGLTALHAIMTIAKDMSPADIEILVTPMLLRIWSSKDRATQLVLLESLKDYLQYLSPKQINDKLFPNLGSTFTDPAPIMRETAVRQIMILVPHLTDRNINGDLLKYLAKTANDQQPGIRTNTTICLGKIADQLGVSSKRKVLTAAFSRSLKDPFVHARMAALQAIGATSEVYNAEDLANRLMPGMMPLLIDGEKTVREQARKTLDSLLSRLEALTKGMPDSLLPPPAAAQESNAASTGSKETAASGTIESAGLWAGWAVSTLSRNVESLTAAPTPSSTSNTGSLPVTRSTTPVPTQRTSTPVVGHSQSQKPSSTLKLSAKPKKIDVAAIYAEDFGNGGDAWGTDDWDEPTSQVDVAKPLAKSTATIIKSTSKPKNHETPISPQIETDDWDTDAW